MATTNTFVKMFTHLKDRPRADKALPLLQRIASLVKPIMRKHGWLLPVLSEFFPESPNLVGLNVNGGQKILLRLRPVHAPDTFYDEEEILHTMLHELTHNVHGPHDEKFYKFLAGLEEEYYALKRSGYAGEGFFSPGQRVGTNVSHNLPPHLARQRAYQAAEKRRQISTVLSGGGKLGGGPVTNKSPRQLAAEAAERRARDERSCASTSGAIAQKEVDRAAKDSLEDKAIDGVDSEIIDGPYRSLAGPSKVAPTTKVPGSRRSASGAKWTTADIATSAGPGVTPYPATEWPCPRCTLVNAAHTGQCVMCDFVRPEEAPQHDRSVPGPQSTAGVATDWACPKCTLVNAMRLSRCAACDARRPNRSLPLLGQKAADSWTCMACGEAGMPNDFWSCRFCGTIKTRS
ncbi:WLM-domain-containing protein [Fomitopsis betulina]|nr:WLM-domain-containing protein [Fomitopsis betulina]